MRKRLNGLAIVGAVVLVCLSARPVAAQAAASGQATSYTIPEYNAYQAATAEKDPQMKIKDLDDFVSKFPNSTLMPYVYEAYYQAYFMAKNYDKTLEYADKLIAMGDKAELPRRFAAIQARLQVFSLLPPAEQKDPAQLTKERDAAQLGLKLLPDVKKAKPDITDDQIKQLTSGLQNTIGASDMQLKDAAGAAEAFKAALAVNPTDAPTSYRLGLAYLGMTPPQSLDGFWALARAIDQKMQGADRVKDYLRTRILAYEQPGCDAQVDAQLSELLQLAANSPDRPATYTIPSHDDLSKVSQSSTIISVIADLGAGGDKAKMTWLAICGAEFPEVVGKIIDVQKTDPAFVNFLIFTSASPDEMQAATMANLSVKVWITAPPAGVANVTAQPDVVRLMKDDEIRFAGSLVSYDPSPFLLHWDQVKVDPSILPEKGTPAKKPAARKPAAK